MSKITLDVNGRSHTLDIEPATPLLYILRNDLGLPEDSYDLLLDGLGGLGGLSHEPAGTPDAG